MRETKMGEKLLCSPPTRYAEYFSALISHNSRHASHG